MTKLKTIGLILCMLLTIIFTTPTFTYARGGDDLGAGILIVIVIVFIVFLILRELMCWYWKINTIVTLLTEIRDGLNNISKKS